MITIANKDGNAFKLVLNMKAIPNNTETSSALCIFERKKPGADPGIWGSSILCWNVVCAGKLLHPTYLTVYY